MEETRENLLTIVYDNKVRDKYLKCGHGFSCLVEHSGKKILFDTGDDTDKLSYNMECLKIDPGTLDALVISHNHWDHTGGIKAVTEKNKNITLYCAQSALKDLRQNLEGVTVAGIGKITEIAPGVFAGPEMKGLVPAEIPLTVDMDKGLVIITGCAHPGIVNIIRKAKEVVQDEILLVLGGFHLMDEKRNTIENIVSEFKHLGVRYVGPSHCSGDLARKLFQETYQDHCLSVGVGRAIMFAELQ